MLETNLAGIKFRNPVLTASGTYGYGDEFTGLGSLEKLGGIVLKGLTLEPRTGNPAPRLVETPSGVINSIGLQNIGLEEFMEKKIPFLEKADTRVIVNVAGGSCDENSRIIEALEPSGAVHLFELNVSCPNVKKGGMAFSHDPGLLAEAVREARKRTGKKLIVKLSPAVTDIAESARIAEGEGADIISAINTVPAMAISVERRRPELANIMGGLSGPAIRPIGVRAVWLISSAVKVPVIGIGGIRDSRDALEYIMAGASAVQVGTALFSDTRAAEWVVDGLAEWVKQENIGSISSIIGAAKQ